jgi:hypothetical protein
MLKYKFNKDKINNNSKSNTKNEIISKCSIIPLNIYQFWYRPELPLNIKNNIEILKKQNPEFNYVLFNDEMCRIFIKNNFDKNVLYAYDKLKPGKYKSELSFAKVEQMPDVNVSATRQNGSNTSNKDSNGVGLSVSIPLLNRNQEKIAFDIKKKTTRCV